MTKRSQTIRQMRISSSSCRILSVRMRAADYTPSFHRAELANKVLHNRLRPRHPRPSIPLLHAPAPPPLQLPLLHLLPPRRPRRLGGTQVPAIHPLRRRPGHDHRPLHHHLPARFSRHREACILHGFFRGSSVWTLRAITCICTPRFVWAGTGRVIRTLVQVGVGL